MGGLLGLMLGVGLLLVWQWFTGSAESRRPHRGRGAVHGRLADLIAEAGIEAITPHQLLASGAGSGAFVGLVFLVASRTWSVALAFAVIAAYAPIALVRLRVRQRRGPV